MKLNTTRAKITNELEFKCIGTENLSNPELDAIKDKLRTFITTLESEMRSVEEIEDINSALKTFEDLYTNDENTKIVIKPTDPFFTSIEEENKHMIRLTLTYIVDLNMLVKTKISPLVETVIEVKNI